MVNGCNEKKVDQDIVMLQLRQAYTDNKNLFDDLKVAITDDSLSEREIVQIGKKIILNNNLGLENYYLRLRLVLRMKKHLMLRS